jgi:hypothetical protein
MFEKGHVAYGKEEPLEDYCYREISNCDVVVCIIGGKYGTQSKDLKNSITQNELKTAIRLGKQIYVFVEKNVHAEYRTYLANKDVKDFRTVAATDKKIYAFLEEIYALPAGNPIESFELPDEIVHYLREQWAGLFQRLLQSVARQSEIDILQNLNTTAATLKQLVTFLVDERSQGDAAIKEILLSTHPAFAAIRNYTDIPYRVVFYSVEELNSLLSSRGFVRGDAPEGFMDWDNSKKRFFIRVNSDIFDEDEKLKVITPDAWKDDFIKKLEFESQEEPAFNDDEIPF